MIKKKIQKVPLLKDILTLIRRFRLEVKRQKQIRDSDVLLISFPKCGRTWLRLLIGRALQIYYNLPEDVGILELGMQLSHLAPEIPNILVFHEDNPHFKLPSELETDKSRYVNKKIIFLVRDPRDVIVSNFFHQKSREIFFEGDMKDFLQNRRGSLETLLEYYKIWAKQMDEFNDFLLVKYENLHKQPMQEIGTVLSFIGIRNVPMHVVELAVQFCAFDNMRKMEQRRKFDSDKLTPAKDDDISSYKTRKGEIGGYKEILTDAQIEYVNERIASRLEGLACYEEYIA